MAESSTILRDVVRPNQANKQLKFIIGGVVVLALIAYLIISAVQQAGSYYREVGEVLWLLGTISLLLSTNSLMR